MSPAQPGPPPPGPAAGPSAPSLPSLPADPLRLQGLAPVVSPQTRLLLLGSFPGVASLQAQQYYAHPRNQFWPLLSALFGLDLRAMDYATRLAALRLRGLGLWDVYASCERQGSLDSAIRQAQFNDLPGLLGQLPQLRGIAHNGAESARARRFTASVGLPVFVLPSSSPANAGWSFERKRTAWAQALSACGLLDGPPSEAENA